MLCRKRFFDAKAKPIPKLDELDLLSDGPCGGMKTTSYKVMPVLLKSGQSASREEAVEEMKDCRSTSTERREELLQSPPGTPLHLLVVDAIEQFRAEDGRQDASNDLLILICYYPGGIFSRERVLNPELIRPLKVEGQDWERAIAALSHLRSPELSNKRIRRTLAHIDKADWASNLPAVVEPGNRRLSRFNRKAHKKIKKDRKMKTLPDLSANVDDELDPPKNILMVMIDDMGLDGTPEADLHPDAVRVGNEEAGPSEAVMEVQKEEPPSSSLGDPSSRWREEASVDDLPVNDPPANENVPIVDPPSVGDDPALIFRNEKIRKGANGPLLISDTSGVDQNEESSKGPSGLSPEDMEESTKDGAKDPAEPSLRTEGDGAFNTED
ncbi:hypothetical protein F2Q69_00023191 [Brassica cretica]|uniref:Uncharacterized protein n=1 Tax=Brassica cretica TaxID=69181 RepID=A0A8S9QU41_BRACR|nr:hypothetical protein F2Q69_00023191 [Brassica cretica]